METPKNFALEKFIKTHSAQKNKSSYRYSGGTKRVTWLLRYQTLMLNDEWIHSDGVSHPLSHYTIPELEELIKFCKGKYSYHCEDIVRNHINARKGIRPPTDGGAAPLL